MTALLFGACVGHFMARVAVDGPDEASRDRTVWLALLVGLPAGVVFFWEFFQ